MLHRRYARRASPAQGEIRRIQLAVYFRSESIPGYLYRHSSKGGVFSTPT